MSMNDENIIYLVSPEIARKEARKELGIATRQDSIGMADQLSRINELAASYNYDAMRLVLGILRGTAQAYEAAGKVEIYEALTKLLNLCTELDVILEVHDNFQDILGSGKDSQSANTLWAKVSEAILSRD